MKVGQVICGRNVETGFIPEEGQAQQGRVQQENDGKNQRKNSPEGELRLRLEFGLVKSFAFLSSAKWKTAD